ncbi:alpha/beta fold hydrolase [Cyanobium sp. Morenito 9A2]|uniref:YheT family hydrolase n=1 Tax=Cyanobium sp. Morenito 9A2 TaxID=2823718 RepID=UPI0020CC2C65|nr:alpha/beta fold hydrolase [Cyanobium sp. Morenito 9A2]MCP9849757.1 alpha/beta hydrolase [Cyanobium sp. Morenito 9A2]
MSANRRWERPPEGIVASLGLRAFRPRAPWWGADLQTLRDTLRQTTLPPEHGEPFEVPIGGGDRLLALLDRPTTIPRALVLLAPGLGGHSEGEGVGRLALGLQRAGLAVLRLNLRGAGRGRPLARGTYAAQGNRDLAPVLAWARRLAADLSPAPGPPVPLLGAGISMGGTLLLNAVLDPALRAEGLAADRPLLDGLVTISSPLDLLACARVMERPRNRVYVNWLLRSLRRQTLADPYGVTEQERSALAQVRTIRQFDAVITAPRWGYDSVEHYYAEASPLGRLRAALEGGSTAVGLPPTLVLHAQDDPWVPPDPAQDLLRALDGRPAGSLQVVLTRGGGHNGFHAPEGCWSDQLATRWLEHLADGAR